MFARWAFGGLFRLSYTDPALRVEGVVRGPRDGWLPRGRTPPRSCHTDSRVRLSGGDYGRSPSPSRCGVLRRALAQVAAVLNPGHMDASTPPIPPEDRCIAGPTVLPVPFLAPNHTIRCVGLRRERAPDRGRGENDGRVASTDLMRPSGRGLPPKGGPGPTTRNQRPLAISTCTFDRSVRLRSRRAT
jgi:hypothetical protein